MKLKLIIFITAGVLLAGISSLLASKGYDGAAKNAGNKICPVSGEELGSMGESVQVEYEGEVYNLCCRMCAKDFKKDPEKFVEKIKKEETSKGSHHHQHDHKH